MLTKTQLFLQSDTQKEIIKKSGSKVKNNPCTTGLYFHTVLAFSGREIYYLSPINLNKNNYFQIII